MPKYIISSNLTLWFTHKWSDATSSMLFMYSFIKRGRKLGRCCINRTMSPRYFLLERNISLLRTCFVANFFQVMQWTTTFFVVWPSLNLIVMWWYASFKDTPKHHMRCSSGHILLYLIVFVSWWFCLIFSHKFIM